MKHIGILFTVSLLTLAACGAKEGGMIEGRVSGSPSGAPPPPVMALSESRSDVSYDGSATDNLPQRAGLFLAYTYNRTISVPTDTLKDMVEAHTQLCVDAGPKQCLVTSSNVNGLGTEYANGYLSLKASPDWAGSFLESLPEAVSQRKATVTASSTSAVDLTSQIIDTDSQLKAQKTLRDRLQKLLESRDGNLEELLNVEREFARVQGQIDSYETNLANLRQRVAMSDIYLSYEAKITPVSQSVWRPLGQAIGDFFGTVAYALAGIVNMIAFLLPWVPVVLGFGWLGLFLTRKFRKKPAIKE